MRSRFSVPYLTQPFTDMLGKASRRGVRVRLFTPWPNNKPIVREAMLNGAARYGFQSWFEPHHEPPEGHAY